MLDVGYFNNVYPINGKIEKVARQYELKIDVSPRGSIFFFKYEALNPHVVSL